MVLVAPELDKSATVRKDRGMITGIGTGIYTPREVSHLTGLSPSRVTRWVSGYSFRRGETVRQSGPLIVRNSDHGPSLTFLDLVEVLFVRAFLEHGVTMKTIRTAAAKAVDLFKTHHPFAVKRFETDGRAVFARLIQGDPPTEQVMNVVDGQAVFPEVVCRYLKQLDYDVAGEAARWWPLGKTEPVVVDPNVSFGVPVTTEGYVPTQSVFGALRAGETEQSVANWYGISIDEVRAAEKFEQRLAA